MTKIKKINKGFTLIELLIVIAIIGVLATLLMVNFIGVRQRARDAQRKSDVRQIQAALEIYRSDNQTYPPLAGNGSFSTNNSCGQSLKDPTGASTYMTKIPCDPTSGSYTYSLTASGGYTLVACLENGSDSQKDASKDASCPAGAAASFTVYSP